MVNHIHENRKKAAQDYWREIILKGKNAASYKFALAKSLLEIAQSGKTSVSLEELAVPFSNHICEHVAHSPRQCTCNSSSFIETCIAYNEGRVSDEKRIEVTAQKGFANVIDAFHTVNRETTPILFFEKDYKSGNKRIILTDDVLGLTELPDFSSLTSETEARWNLVETAWALKIPQNQLYIYNDPNEQLLYINETIAGYQNRHNITSTRNAINGYQSGKCFYCYDQIYLKPNESRCSEVNRYFPVILKQKLPGVNFSGVWNLVLTCNRCDYGFEGREARVPAETYLDKLYQRNEFLVTSYLPLSQTIIRETGKTPMERFHFLKKIDAAAIEILKHRRQAEPGFGKF